MAKVVTFATHSSSIVSAKQQATSLFLDESIARQDGEMAFLRTAINRNKRFDDTYKLSKNKNNFAVNANYHYPCC